jgi:hypothetical protein
LPIQSTTLPAASGWTVNDAIRNAARSTGTSFAYLLSTAKAESGLDPKQASATSSARGLFQFIDQTWLMMLKEAGPALGYGRYAQAISAGANGRFEVADPAERSAVLALRDDPAANAALAAAFTKRNAAQLASQLGREPTDGELYIAHFLGAAGAGRLITLAATSPDGPTAAAFPDAAAANRSIFYDRAGQARSHSQVYSLLVGRYDRAREATHAAGGLRGTQPVEPAPLATVAQPAPAKPADATPMFHGLFQNDARRGGVSSFVAELWSTRPHVAAALSGSGLAATEQSTAGAPPGRRK